MIVELQVLACNGERAPVPRGRTGGGFEAPRDGNAVPEDGPQIVLRVALVVVCAVDEVGVALAPWERECAAHEHRIACRR